MKRLPLLILVFALVLFSCSRNKQNATPAGNSGPGRGFAPGSAPAKEYAVIKLTPQAVTVHQDFPARIEGQRVVEIRPMVSGYLQDIYVNEGDRVKKGQLLFHISNPIYEQQVITAKAKINSAAADVNSAKIDVEKIRPLVEKEIVSSYRLKSAELILEARNAALEQAKADLVNANTNLGYTYIKSPQDGIIGTFPYKSGALVGSNSTEALTTLSDISSVFAYFSWNEKQLLDILYASSGKSMEDKIKTFPEASLILANSKEYNLKGKVELASGLISTSTGAATFKAIFPNPDGIIRSGSSATVRLPQVKDSVFVIPQGATYELQNKRFVYKVGADNRVTAIPVTSIPSDNGKFFLVTDGLRSGDIIVTGGTSSLRDGTTIIPREVNEVSYYNQVK
ncbi:MAG TPA: efflux RND transporter periplasmic adaptor subunit [Bacteroidales bacterium]|nr:efflux RND transporter periplasmic adaptor subunit [Bacteroidales bacterium]